MTWATEPGPVLDEARRVFGPDAELHYGARWVTVGIATQDVPDEQANEISCFGDDPMTRMLACLRALPEQAI